jgi:antitoxin component YwqK of YwqJK toxin-antitoxin module
MLQAQELTNGKYTEHYEGGQTKVKGYYKNGQKHRNWIHYRSNGIMEKREVWKKGILQGIYLYNEKGRLESITGKNGKTRLVPCNCQ